MALQFAFKTRSGIFHIAPVRGGWGLFFEREYFDGPFNTPQQALDDLAGGHCYWPTCEDPSELGIAEDLSDWVPLVA